MSKLLAGVQRYLQAAVVKSVRVFLIGQETETFEELLKLVFPTGIVRPPEEKAGSSGSGGNSGESKRNSFYEVHFPIHNTLVQVMHLEPDSTSILKSNHDVVIYAVDGNEPNTWPLAIQRMEHWKTKYTNHRFVYLCLSMPNGSTNGGSSSGTSLSLAQRRFVLNDSVTDCFALFSS